MLVRDGKTHWDGVRNHQAAIYLRSMKIGDECFFYHSNEGLAIVGIMKIVGEHYIDPADPAGRFPCVDVAPVRALAVPVTLAAMTPVIRVGRVNRVDWGIAAASNEMAGAQHSLSPY